MDYQDIELDTDINKKIEINIKMAEDYELARTHMYNKLYLGEIIASDKPKFDSNNLILAPVGSGKSYLMEKMLIPKNCTHDILYLTSSTALKDSICPDDNALRKALAESGMSVKFYTSGNTKRYGDAPYSVHVMTYHEFGKHLDIPSQGRALLNNVKLVFCDEIHSLPTYESYKGNQTLSHARAWLFNKHEDKQIYYFTATKENIDKMESQKKGTLDYVTIFNYLDHPKIRRYVTNSTVFINNIEQIRPHLKYKLDAFNYYGYKGLAFTARKEEQRKIAEIAIEEGYNPIILWSTNNEEKMNEEQLKVRAFLLSTGMIPEPYNLLIINGSMQEGWNLTDKMMRLAILDTLDVTEQIQALGRIRRNIDLLVCKAKTEDEKNNIINLPEEYINQPLNTAKKTDLYHRLNIISTRGTICKWPTIKKLLMEQGYDIEDKTATVDGKRQIVSVISPSEPI